MDNSISLGSYQLTLPPIYNGGSVVYRGYDKVTQRVVAIKASKHIAEGKIQARLMESYGWHQALPKFCDFFVEQDLAHIVMEFVSGQRLNQPRPTPARSPLLAVEITLRILQGLAHLHQSGILHYDIAHHNVMIEGNDPSTVKIVDFGSCKRLTKAGEWLNTRVAGTINFRPPEQERVGAVLRASADIYATARLCYWMITKQLPTREGKLELADQRLTTILTMATELNPSKRYQRAEDFYGELEGWRRDIVGK